MQPVVQNLNMYVIWPTKMYFPPQSKVIHSLTNTRTVINVHTCSYFWVQPFDQVVQGLKQHAPGSLCVISYSKLYQYIIDLRKEGRIRTFPNNAHPVLYS